MGATPDDIAAAQAQQTAAATQHASAEVFLVWESNRASFEAFFFGLRTQWQYAGMQAQRTGLNYAGVHTYLQLSTPRRQWRGLFADVQLMESAVLGADQELKDTEPG